MKATVKGGREELIYLRGDCDSGNQNLMCFKEDSVDGMNDFPSWVLLRNS